MNDFDSRREAVCGAGGIGDDAVVFRIIGIFVYAEDKCDIGLCRRGGYYDFFGPACFDMLQCILSFAEKACGFDHDRNSQVFPGEICRISFCKDFCFFAVDDNGILCGTDVGIKNAEHRVVFQQMSQSFGVYHIVGRNDFDIRVLIGGPEYVSSDSAESIYAYFYCHENTS